MTSQRQIQDALAGVARHFAQHPEQAQSTDKPAVAVWQGGLRFEAQGAGGAVLRSDMPVAVGGSGESATPGWLLRAALASCNASMIALRAAQTGITLTRLEVTVDSDSDDRGLLGLADVHPGPLRTRIRVRIAAEGASDEQLQALVAWAEAHSPVADALRRPVPLGTVVEIG